LGPCAFKAADLTRLEFRYEYRISEPGQLQQRNKFPV